MIQNTIAIEGLVRLRDHWNAYDGDTESVEVDGENIDSILRRYVDRHIRIVIKEIEDRDEP